MVFRPDAGVGTKGSLRDLNRRVEDPFGPKKSRGREGNIYLKTTDWVSAFINIKDGDTGVASAMNFSERRYLLRPYNTASRKILFMTSRQTEKSTTLANKLMALCGMRSMYTTLFVTPSAMQTSVFSKARLDDIIDISPLLRSLTHPTLTMNILEKEFINKSKIYLRYAFLSADRIRGLSVNAVFCDEIQDLLSDVMPVIEETASHHKDPLFIYSGTPKSFDNTIESYWSKSSTQNEWVIPCEAHGTPNNPMSWYWIVLGVKNIGKTGPICDRCGKPLNPEHPKAQWVEMNPPDPERPELTPFEGFRICRLMVPWYSKDPNKWKEILDAQARYPMAQFMNEIMALSYDSGTKPLSRAEVIRACDPVYDMDEDKVVALGHSHTLYGGIDWGADTTSAYTVLTVGGYTRGDAGYQIVYAKRFDGPLVDPEPQLEEIIRLIKKFRLKYVGTDYGMGFHPNKKLSSVFGPKRIHPFQYVVRAPGKLIYKRALHRYLIFRSPVMSDVFNAIKAMKIRFPNWEQFKTPFAEDMLSIRAEYNNTIRMLQYDKPRGVPDDTFHSVMYCLLASMFDNRRPDIIAPVREVGADAAASVAEDWAREEIEYHSSQDWAQNGG